jgi:superfamily II DNA or RNA helicase
LRPTNFNLRPWQSSALQAWRNAGHSGIVEVVTGGGKTRFALAAIQEFLGREALSAIAVLVPTTALQDQWYVNLTSDLGIPAESICLWPECQDPSRPFHILVINTARTRLSEVSAAHSSLLVIADECHRYASEQNAKALFAPKCASLGLTATAERDFDDGLERYLIPHLGPIIFRYTLKEARRDGVVVDFDLFNVEVPLTAKEIQTFEGISQLIGRATARGEQDRVKRLAMRRAAVSKNAIARITASVAIAERLRGRRLLVFHEDIARANLIASLLTERNHRAVAYHSKIGRDMRRDNLRMFKVGMVDVLVCCRALDEGIDVPEADSAILAASTSSHRQRVQRLGRVLRLHDGKERAQIYTVYATEQEAQRLVSEMQNLEGIAETRWLQMSV